MSVPKFMSCCVMCLLIVAASVAAGETAVRCMRFDASPLGVTREPSQPSGEGEAFHLIDFAVYIDRDTDGVQQLKYVHLPSRWPFGRAPSRADYKLSFNRNVEDLQYAVIPDEACPSGETGVLRLSFKTGNDSYYSAATLRVKVPAFDATGATLRLWIRHIPRGPSLHMAVQVSLNDRSGEMLERWRYYNIPSGEWHCVEVTQGDRSGTSAPHHHAVAFCQDDLTRVSEVSIRVFGYNTQEGDDFYIGCLEAIPASEPRHVAPRQVKDLAGSWRLRPEAGVDGEGECWFDPALDNTDFGEEVMLGFWDAKNDPVAWYRKTFALTPEMLKAIQGKGVYLLFFGVDESCWLWLNGQSLGSHSADRKEGWDKPFAVNVTEHLRAEGKNLLAVKVLNRERAGGIWRPVWLVTAD